MTPTPSEASGLIGNLPEQDMTLLNYLNNFLRTSPNITSKPVMFGWVVSWRICLRNEK
jgi:hypothetical protein